MKALCKPQVERHLTERLETFKKRRTIFGFNILVVLVYTYVHSYSPHLEFCPS
ncbi:uncharacterized protein DS421_10g303740 [Arachis hypogaea]|nr:uncharacterized protein DS421_10g303740 [Arachis hypogaea]